MSTLPISIEPEYAFSATANFIRNQLRSRSGYITLGDLLFL